MSSKKISYVVCAGVGIAVAGTVAFFNATPSPQAGVNPSTAPAVAAAPQPAPAPVVLIEDATDPLTRQRLAPIRRLTDPSFLPPAESRPVESPALDASSRPLLTPTEIRRQPLPSAGPKIARPLHGSDLPVLTDLASAPPAAPVLPAGPRFSAELSATPSPLIRLPLVLRQRPEPIESGLDPSLEATGRPGAAPPPIFRLAPAPYLPASDPDPLANESAIRLPTPPADDDPPASALPRPSRPLLPTK